MPLSFRKKIQTIPKMIKHNLKLKFDEKYRMNQCQHLYNYRKSLYDLLEKTEYEGGGWYDIQQVQDRIKQTDDIFNEWNCHPFLEARLIGDDRKVSRRRSRRRNSKKRGSRGSRRSYTRKSRH